MKFKLSLIAVAAIACAAIGSGLHTQASSTPPDPVQLHQTPHAAIELQPVASPLPDDTFKVSTLNFPTSPLVGVWTSAGAIDNDGATGVYLTKAPHAYNWRTLVDLLPLALGGVISAPIDVKERSGEIITIPVAAATHLYPGGMIAVNAAGYAVPASDTAALRCRGRCETEADNSLGANGDISVQVKRGVFRYVNSTGDAIARADVGNTAFVEDDQTVNKTGGTNKISAGTIVDIDAGYVWIDTRRSSASGYTLTSSQNATANGSDATTTQTLANALKVSYNQLQADVAALARRAT